MILVIDNNLKEIRIWAFEEKDGKPPVRSFAKNIDEIKDAADLARYMSSVTGRHKPEAISFRILFGGDMFKKDTLIEDGFFDKLERLTELFPFYIPAMLWLLKAFRRLYRDVPLIACFDTAFFSMLPDDEKYYALPFKYQKDNGIKKWGFHAIFHEANAGLFPSGDRNISVVIDKQTTVCAAYENRPFSISLGYTPLEGIMSRTSCGDLDPGIVFYLMNVRGLSIYEIDDILKNRSGFFGLTGYDIDLTEMIKLRGRDSKVDLAFDIYQNQLIKHIGEGMSAVGGVDNIIFAGEYVDAFTPIIHSIIKRIAFLGVHVDSLPWSGDGEIVDISSAESKIKAYINKATLARLIFRRAGTFLHKIGKQEKLEPIPIG